VIPYGYILSLGLFWPTVYVDLLHKQSSCIRLYRYRRSEVQTGRITLYTKTDANGYATTSLTKAFTDPRYKSLSDLVRLINFNIQHF